MQCIVQVPMLRSTNCFLFFYFVPSLAFLVSMHSLSIVLQEFVDYSLTILTFLFHCFIAHLVFILLLQFSVSVLLLSSSIFESCYDHPALHCLSPCCIFYSLFLDLYLHVCSLLFLDSRAFLSPFRYFLLLFLIYFLPALRHYFICLLLSFVFQCSSFCFYSYSTSAFSSNTLMPIR